jgi:hypothetical protein
MDESLADIMAWFHTRLRPSWIGKQPIIRDFAIGAVWIVLHTLGALKVWCTVLSTDSLLAESSGEHPDFGHSPTFTL